MKKRHTYQGDLMKRLKNSRYALGYLNAALEDDDEGVFLLALRDVAEAQGGLRKIAKKSGLNREHLFRMLSRNGNPRLESLRHLAHAFGWRIALMDEESSSLRRAA